MSRGLLITGTDTEVGKTWIACGLAQAARARGIRVGVMKPAETGCVEVDGLLKPADADALAAAASTDLSSSLISPYRYRSPLAPAVAAEMDHLSPANLNRIGESYERICRRSDLVIVEGAGGITVPITWTYDYADLALRLDLEVVLVVGNRLGCLNVACLTFEYAQNRGIKMAGWLLNDNQCLLTPASTTNEQSLRRLTDIRKVNVRFLGRNRFKQEIAPEIVAGLIG